MNGTNKKPVKWYTILEIIDSETGEILTKSQFERNDYIIKNKENVKKFDEYNNRGTTTIRWICEKNPQQKLF